MSCPRRLHTSPVPHDKCVDHARAGAALQHDDGIEVDLCHVAAEVVCEPGEPDDQVDERVRITRSHTAYAFEEPGAAQLVQHVTRVRCTHWRGAVGHVLQHLHVNAAQTDHDDGPEDRI